MCIVVFSPFKGLITFLVRFISDPCFVGVTQFAKELTTFETGPRTTSSTWRNLRVVRAVVPDVATAVASLAAVVNVLTTCGVAFRTPAACVVATFFFVSSSLHSAPATAYFPGARIGRFQSGRDSIM